MSEEVLEFKTFIIIIIITAVAVSIREIAVGFGRFLLKKRSSRFGFGFCGSRF